MRNQSSQKYASKPILTKEEFETLYHEVHQQALLNEKLQNLKTRLQIRKAFRDSEKLRSEHSEGSSTSHCSHGVSSSTPRPPLYSGEGIEEQSSIIYSTPQGVRKTPFRRSDLNKFYIRNIERLGGSILSIKSILVSFELWLTPENIIQRTNIHTQALS